MKNTENSQPKKTPKMTFSDEETEAYRHKVFFLHYLHQIEPRIGKTLQEFFPSYINSFGGHKPVDREALTHPFGFPEFFKKYFALSSWQETNQETKTERGLGENGRRYLAEHNGLVKTIQAYKSLRLTAIEDNVREMSEHPETSVEFPKIHGLRNELVKILYQKAVEDDEYLQRANEFENLVSQLLSQFRLLFFEKLIKRFHLETEWLCLSAFLAIQEAKSKLEMPWVYTMHSYPIEMLQELHRDELDSSIMSFFLRSALPLHKGFQFNKPFGIHDKAEEYEERAVDAYREHLTKYVREMQQALLSHGYKLMRRRNDYSRVEWLVRWTVQSWTVPQIASEYNAQESTIWKAFKSFEKYDLPVRKKNPTRV